MADGGSLGVSCDQDDQVFVSITVSDTGDGIEAEHLSQIFNPYFTTKNRGTGLGLAIVHKIVEAHEGHLSVDSVPGRGTRMIIRIPCQVDSA
jgi:signal transduction histidine kinase